MKFLTEDAARSWCNAQNIQIILCRDDQRTDDYSDLYRIQSPRDTGKMVWLSKLLIRTVDFRTDCLLWIMDWSIWPSCEHLPLINTLRAAFGDASGLSKTPAHLLAQNESDFGISVLFLAQAFYWNVFFTGASGSTSFYISHDEYILFRSSNREVVELYRNEFLKQGWELESL